jgi:hypothetical protein
MNNEKTTTIADDLDNESAKTEEPENPQRKESESKFTFNTDLRGATDITINQGINHKT